MVREMLRRGLSTPLQALRQITKGKGMTSTTSEEMKPGAFCGGERPSDYIRGLQEGIRLAAEAANGVEPALLEGMSERYVSIYCTARRDASDSIKEIPRAPCPSCGGGSKRTGLPCEDCLNTGLAHPEFEAEAIAAWTAALPPHAVRCWKKRRGWRMRLGVNFWPTETHTSCTVRLESCAQ